MRVPGALTNLIDEGIIDEVVRPLMSGKEAQVYLVLAGGTQRVAKVYKEAQNRSFKHRTSYTEGRKVRNSRDQRAISKRSKYGRAEDESAWKSTEVDMIYRLRAAGVRVPEPYQFIDGVLIMELVTSAEGIPAPRLCDGHFTPQQAVAFHERLLGEAIKMLCAGVVHGDLSEFNVLIGADGPVIIDFPQAIDASKNQNARSILLRDVANLNRFLARYVPGSGHRPYAEEMWALYESSRLAPDTVLRGRFRGSTKKVDTKALLELVEDANEDERRRRIATGGDVTKLPPRPKRVEVIVKQTDRSGPARRRQFVPRSEFNQRPAQGPNRGRDAEPRRGGGPARGAPSSSLNTNRGRAPRPMAARGSDADSARRSSPSSAPRSAPGGPRPDRGSRVDPARASRRGPPHSGPESARSSLSEPAGGGTGASPGSTPRRRRRRRREGGAKSGFRQ